MNMNRRNFMGMIGLGGAGVALGGAGALASGSPARPIPKKYTKGLRSFYLPSLPFPWERDAKGREVNTISLPLTEEEMKKGRWVHIYRIKAREPAKRDEYFFPKGWCNNCNGRHLSGDISECMPLKDYTTTGSP